MDKPPTSLSLVALAVFATFNVVLIRALLLQMARELAEAKESGEEKPADRVDIAVDLLTDALSPNSASTDNSASLISGKFRQLFWIAGILAADVWTIRALWPWLLS
jgi:hypothetical protein